MEILILLLVLVNFSQKNKFVAIGRWITSTIENLFDVESSPEAIR